MKFLVKFILIILLSYLAQQFLPWWSVVAVSFLICTLIYTSGFNSFLSGFLGVGLLWLTFAWLIDNQTESYLTLKVTNLFKLDSTLLLIGITGLVGGLAAGFGGLTGSHFRKVFTRSRKQRGYYN